MSITIKITVKLTIFTEKNGQIHNLTVDKNRCKSENDLSEANLYGP